jgi:hypothetical protein
MNSVFSCMRLLQSILGGGLRASSSGHTRIEHKCSKGSRIDDSPLFSSLAAPHGNSRCT